MGNSTIIANIVGYLTTFYKIFNQHKIGLQEFRHRYPSFRITGGYLLFIKKEHNGK